MNSNLLTISNLNDKKDDSNSKSEKTLNGSDDKLITNFDNFNNIE